MIQGNALWRLIAQTDAMSMFVLLVLLGMSVAMWTLFLCNVFLSFRKKRDMQHAIMQMHGMRRIEELALFIADKRDTLPGYFVAHCIAFGKLAHEGESVEQVRGMIDQEIDTLVIREERYIPLLSTSAVISPLLGLLGTVWGLIHAFISISQTQMADIVTVAPGIAEALITTLAGLIVAIPAVVMVNYVTAQVARIEQQLVIAADIVMRVIQRSLIQKKEEVCVDVVVGGQKEAQQ